MIFHLTKNLFYTLLLLVHQKDALQAVYDERYSCGTYTCDGDRLTQPCGCDELCGVYGDCCPDHSWGRESGGAISSGISRDMNGDRQSHTRTWGSDYTPESDHTPYPVDPSLVSCVNLRFSWSYFLVNRCPTEWNDAYVREMCEEEWPGTLLEYLIPVTSTITGLSYKNTFCAACHNERLENIHMWAYHLDCGSDTFGVSNPIPDGLYNQLDRCDVVFEEPARRLCIGAAKRCPDTASESHVATRNCNHFVDYVSVGKAYYQNAYCLECNGLSTESPVCDDRDFISQGRTVPLSSLANLWVESDTEFDAHMKRPNILNITLEPKLICEGEPRVYTNGNCMYYDCPWGFRRTQERCRYDSRLMMGVCAAREVDSTQMFRGISATQWTQYPFMVSLGLCNDNSETFRTHELQLITNTDMLISLIQDIITHSTFDYRKLTIISRSSFIFLNETRTRFVRNCTNLNHTGSAAENYDLVLRYLTTLNGSAPIDVFSLNNQKIDTSDSYHIQMEICSMEEVCPVVIAGILLPRDVNAMADKVWAHVARPDGKPRSFVCTEDIERYEDLERMDRNRNLVQFFVSQLQRDKNSARGVNSINSLLYVLMLMGFVCHFYCVRELSFNLNLVDDVDDKKLTPFQQSSNNIDVYTII